MGPSSSEDHSSPGGSARRVAAWTALYLISGFTVSWLQPEPGQSPWYPTIAVGIALLFLCGNRWWPVVAAAELAVSWSQYGSFTPAAVSTVLTVAGVAAIAAGLRWQRFDPEFGEPRDLITLTTTAAGVLAAASIVAVVVIRATGFESGSVLEMLEVRFIGRLTGITVFLPVLLLLAVEPRHRLRAAVARVEAAPLQFWATAVAGFVTVTWAFAGTWSASGPTFEVTDLDPFLLCFLPLLWLAIRFGRVPTIVFSLLANIAAIVAVSVVDTRTAVDNPELVTIQLFMLVASLSGLLVASAMEAQAAARRRERSVVEHSPTAIVTLTSDARISSWNPAAERIFGWSADERLGTDGETLLGPSVLADATRGRAPMAREVVTRRRDGSTMIARVVASPVGDDAELGAAVVALVEDITSAVETRRMLELLDQAIAQAAEAVIITDPSGSILFINPATVAMSGYSPQELIGASPRILGSGLHDPSFFARMWADLRGGHTWHGVLTNRSKQGVLHEVEVTISPVRSADHEIVAYVSVQRDLARERSLEADLEQERRDRRLVTEALAGVAPGDTLQDTVVELCRAVTTLDGFERAAVLREDADGVLRPLGLASRDSRDLLTDALDATTSQRLLEVLRSGPAVFDLRDMADFEGSRAAASATRTTAVGAAVIERGPSPATVVLCGTSHPGGRSWLEGRRTTLAAVAIHAVALLGPQLANLTDRDAARAQVLRTLDEHAYGPVYQPVVELATRRVVGYEALTRFDDGSPPHQMFERAWRVGMGTELEAACIRAAVVGATRRGDEWLSVNASPATVLHESLHPLVDDGSRLVLEVTEHVAVEDYAALRAAIAGIPGLRVAVDDAGAGHASLRHILELRPDLVKLDIGLVRGVDSDLSRQALIAGMRHFADATGMMLIAEGIETEDELRTITELGVHFGQGYLLGRPGPLP